MAYQFIGDKRALRILRTPYDCNGSSSYILLRGLLKRVLEQIALLMIYSGFFFLFCFYFFGLFVCFFFQGWSPRASDHTRIVGTVFVVCLISAVVSKLKTYCFSLIAHKTSHALFLMLLFLVHSYLSSGS